MSSIIWYYKDHKCIIDEEREEDCIKHHHLIVTPNGKLKYADITPYDSSKKTLELWIDVGYPVRSGVCPLRREDLEKMQFNT